MIKKLQFLYAVLGSLLGLLLTTMSKGVSAKSLVLHPNPVSRLNLRTKYDAVCFFFSADDDGKYAYVSGGKAGTFIISLENPQIQKVVSIIPGFTVQHALRFGDNLFVSDQFTGLSIFNVTDITTPTLIKSLIEYGEHTQYSIVTKDGKYLFVLNSGLIQAFDITDINAPVHLNQQTLGVTAPYSYRLKFNSDETFIAVSNHLSGVQIIDIRNMPFPIMRVNKNPIFVTWDCVFTNDMKVSYAADAYYGLFIADISGMSGIDPTSTQLFDPNWEQIYPVHGALMMSLHITQDNNHLLVGFRSIGIYLFSIDKTNYKSITFVQHLQGSYMSVQIFMPKNNESLLLATNGNQFFIFEAVTPILNQEFPNLMNTYQSSLTTRSLTQLNPFVYCMKDQKHIITTNIDDNFTIYNIEDPYELKKVASVARGPTQGVLNQAEVSSDFKYLFITSSNSGILTYDISDLTSPTYISTFTPLPPIYGNQVISLKLNPTNSIGIVANSFYGVYYVNTSDPSALSNVAAFMVTQACGFQDCVLLKNQVHIICACREIGVYFFQVVPRGTGIEIVSIFRDIGSEALLLSADEKTLFACLGFQGVYLIDISDFQNPTYISSIILKGWAQQLWVLFDEKYLIASEAEKGQLSLINIEDRTNPYIQQILEFQDEDSISLCVPSDEKTTFFVGIGGLRQIPIISDLKIHTQIQIQVLDSSGDILYYDTIKEGEPLLVGQVAQFTFVPLFTEKKVKIADVKYYRYFEKQTLPSWMNYLPDKQQIVMTVDKLGVRNDFSTERNGENILVLEIYIEVKAADLVLAGLITPALSLRLFTSLKEQGYLDYFGLLTSKLDPREKFALDFFDGSTYTSSTFDDATLAAIYLRVKKVLVYSKYDYPIRFFVKSSLTFAYNSNLRMLSSKRNLETSSAVVSTPSSQIKVFMQIGQNGKFVKRTFEGVLASFSDDLTSVQISGQTSYVDAILQKNIQISNSTADLSQVPITVLVSDSSNYDLQIETSLIQLEFASFHKQIVYNTDKPLSSQLDRVYSGGSLPVESRFQFSFDMSTFTQADNLPLTYKAYIVNIDGSESEIVTGLWIEFSTTSLGFSGIRTIGAYRDTVKIKIVADDSYSTQSATFDIDFTIIPFFYLIQVGVSIIGPLLGVLGIWKYRHEIHLFLVERSHMYSDEIAIMGTMYKKQIILLSTIQEEGHNLWKVFLKNQPDYVEEKVLKYYKENKSVDMPAVMEHLERVYLPIQDQFPSIDPREFDFNDSRLVRVIKQIIYQTLLKKDKNTQEAIRLLKVHASKEFHNKDWYKLYIQINPKIEIVKNKVTRKKLSLQENNVVGELREDKITSMKITPILEANEEIDIDEASERNLANGHFNFLSPMNSRPNETERAVIGENEESKLNIEDQTLKDQFFDLNPFPEMVVKEQIIVETLNTLQFVKEYDFHLLTEYIALEASGFIAESPSMMNPAVGESIHESSDSLLTLSAYKRNNIGFIGSVMGFLNMDYVPIGLVKNNPLPKWLNYQIVDGIINIWGVPTLSDESEILIRIINTTLITVHSFRILVQDKDRHDCRDRNLRRKVTKKIGANVSGQFTRQKVHTTVRLYSKSNLLSSDGQLKSEPMLQAQQSENERAKIQSQNNFKNSQTLPRVEDILIELDDSPKGKQHHEIDQDQQGNQNQNISLQKES